MRARAPLRQMARLMAPPGSVGCLNRLDRVCLLDAGSRHLGLDPGSVEGGQNFLAGEALRLRDLVNPFTH